MQREDTEASRKHSIEIERVRQGYIELAQNAAKLNLDTLGDINTMLTQTNEHMLDPTGQQPSVQDQMAQLHSAVETQSDAHAQALNQLSQHLAAIHGELRKHADHRERAMQMAQSLLQEP